MSAMNLAIRTNTYIIDILQIDKLLSILSIIACIKKMLLLTLPAINDASKALLDYQSN
jgi:hypothetical protein